MDATKTRGRRCKNRARARKFAIISVPVIMFGVLPHVFLMREVREQGYDGGITQLKEFLAAVRPTPEPEPIMRFETAPGEQMQIDFVVFRRTQSPLRAFTASLAFSRMAYAEFVDNERAETWIGCLQNALSAFGGSPNVVLCDKSQGHCFGPRRLRARKTSVAPALS